MAPRYVISATTTITHRVVVEAPNIEAIDVEDARANDKLDLTIDESGEVISG